MSRAGAVAVLALAAWATSVLWVRHLAITGRLPHELTITLGSSKQYAAAAAPIPAAAQLSAPQPPFHRPGAAHDLAFSDKLAAHLPLHASSFSCTKEGNPVHSVCLFSNMVLHAGDLIYVVKNEAAARAVRLPQMHVQEVGNNKPFLPQLPEYVWVATAPEVRARLVAAAAGNGTAGTMLQVARFEHAILQSIRTLANWFWALNGAGNIYHRLCKYLGACDREGIQAAAILQVSRRARSNPVMRIGLPKDTKLSSVKELLHCMGPYIEVNRAEGDRSSMTADARVLLLQTLLVGVGSDVPEPLSAKGPDQRQQFMRANASMALRRVQFLRQCARLPADPPPMRTPSVLLVNRPYVSGRHIIGLDDVYDRLRRQLPPEVPVRVYLPRAESLAAQAQVFASANVVVVPHGAGNANFVFLPHTAVIFALYALLGRHALDRDHASAPPAPIYNLTVVSVDCARKVQLRTAAVARLPAFKKLGAADQAYLLSGQPMQGAMLERVKTLLGLSGKQLMEFGAYSPDPEELAGRVAAAVEAMMPKRQRVVPSDGGSEPTSR